MRTIMCSGTAALLITLATAPLAAQVQGRPQPAAPLDAVADPASVAKMATTLAEVVAQVGPNASSADIEAQLAFAVSQADQPPPVVIAALQQVTEEQTTPRLRLALTRFTITYKRRGRVGTAGILTGGGPAELAGGPVVGGGGTGTDYSRP
jgi:hypothetical protein